MLDTRILSLEGTLLESKTYQVYTKILSELRKRLKEGLSESKLELYEEIKNRETEFCVFQYEVMYKLGFLDGLETTILAQDKHKILETLDDQWLKQM